MNGQLKYQEKPEMNLNNSLMRLFLSFIIVVSLFSCKKEKLVQKTKYTSSIPVLINEAAVSFYHANLRYPKDEYELIRYIKGGDTTVIDYYESLINYRFEFSFNYDLKNDFVIVEGKDFNFRLTSENVCYSIKQELPNLGFMNKTVFYKNGEIVIESNEFMEYRKQWWEIVKPYYDKPLAKSRDFEFLKFSSINNQLESMCMSKYSNNNVDEIKGIESKLSAFLMKNNLDSIFMTIKF